MISNSTNSSEHITVPRQRIRYKRGLLFWSVCWLSMSVCMNSVLQQTVLAQKPVAHKEASSSDQKKWPKTAVYIPVDELDALLMRDRSGVLLPRTQYEALKKQAKVNSDGNVLPNSNIIIHDATYQATVSDRQLMIEATISIQQFQQKMTVVNLPLHGLAVESAMLDQQPAMIARSSGKIDLLQLFSQQQGEHQFVIKLSAPLNTVGSDQVAQFRLLPNVASRFKLEIPSNQYLIVNDLRLKPSTKNKKTGYEFPIGGTGQVNLKITEQTHEQTNDSLVFARSAIGVSVSPGKVAWQAQTALSIYGQSLDQIILSVPQSLEIVSVESTGLESWELNDSVKDQQRTEITLNYRQPIEGELQIICRGVMTTKADQAWNVPDLHIEKVNSHVGSVLIRYPYGVRLQVENTDSVRRRVIKNSANMKKATERSVNSPGMDFDFWQQMFDITLVTQEKRSEVQMAASTIVEINEQGMNLQLVTTVESLFAPLFEFQMHIPAEWTILGATIQNQNANWKESSREAGSKLIRLPFVKVLPANTEAKVVILAHRDLENWPPDSGSQLLELPKIELPQAKILEGSIIINADSDWDLVPSGLTNLEPMQERISKMRFGYQYQDNNYKGSLTVSRKPLQLAARHLQYVRLDQTTFFSHFETTLNVERGSYRKLMVALPESVGTDLQFRLMKTDGKIIEQVADKPQNGLLVWTLKMDRRLSGKQILVVTIEQPRKEGEIVTIPQLQIMSADRQYGEVAFEAEGDQRLRIQTMGLRGQPLTSIDAAELQLPVTYRPRERIVAAYRFVGVGHQIKAEETRFKQTVVPTAIAHQLALKSLLGHAGEVQNEVLLSFSAVGIQSLKVALPDQALLLSALVDGIPVEVRNTGKAFIIPVASGSQSAGTRTLKLLYDVNQRPLDQTQQFSQSPPQVAVVDGAGQTQPLEILNQSWSVLYPDELLITESKGDFIPAKPLLRPGMLESIRRQLSLLSPRQMVGRLFMLFFICIAILICTYCFRRGGISGIAFLIGGFCVLFLMILLLMPVLNSKRALVRISSSRNLQEQPGQAVAAYSSDDGSETDGYYLKDKMEMIPNVQDGIETESMGRSRVSGVAERAEKALGLQRDQSQLAVPMDQPALAKSPQGVRSHTIIRNAPKSQHPEPSASIEIEGKLGGLGGGALPAAETPAAPKEQSKNDFVAGFESPLPARTLGGRLSVVAPLPEPVGFHSLAFQYYGAPRQEPLSLSISLQQSQRSRRFFLAVVAGLLWLSWLFRGISCRRKLALVIFGILLPVTCSALVSAQYQSLLDGVFWGSILTSILWSLEWFYQRLRSEIKALLHSTDKQATVTSLILLGSFLCSPEAVFAQKKPVVEPKLPQNLVIPYEVGKDPLSSQRIFLSREEFIKLWNKAHPDQRVNQESESGGVISQALYSAKVKAGAEAGQAIVHVKGRLVIHTIGNQPATLPLPLGEAAISSALLDGKSATILVRQAKTKKTRLENVYSIVISKPGLHLLDLEFDLPARQTGVTGSFRISLQPVASGRFTLELSDKDSQISITGSRASYRKQTLSGKTTLELPIDQGGTIQFAWRPAEERGAIQGIVQCKSTQATVVQDAGLVLRNEYDYRVRQGEINQASLKISEGLRIQSIDGPDVGGWEMVGTGEERRVKVFLRRDIKDSTKINIVAFHPLSVSKQSRVVNIPQIAPENITNETGTVGVYAESQFQIRPEEIAGAIQIDVGQFKNPATSSPALKVASQVLRPQWAYRFSRRPLIFRFSVFRRQPEKLAVAEHAVLVSPRKMSLSSRVKYQLKGTPESTFVIELPETYLILNVNAKELDDWYIIEQNADDMRVLILEFKELKTNQVEVVFDGVISRNANKLEAEVMMPTPLEVSSVRSDLAIWCDDSLLASAPELKDWRSISPEDLSAELKEQQPRLPQFAFRSTAELPEWINLELSPAQPIVTANSLVMTTVGNVSVSYTVGIRWTIQGAATDVFSFSTPAWLGEQLDFRGESIRQVDKKVIGGAVVQWTIYLQDSVEGSYFITAESTLSPPDSGKIEIPQVRVMDTRGNVDPQTTELETQQHFLMLVNHSWARLSLLNQESIAPVERQEMPLVINDSLANQAMELARIIRNRKPPIYQIQQFQADQGAAAAVNLADLTTVLANDGSWKTQADYRIRNRSRQFLAIRLPEKTQVLSAFVKGRPTAPVLLKPDPQNNEIKKNLIYLVALPKASAADLSFSVKLIIAGRLAQPLSQSTFRWQAQLVDMQPPQVVIPSENADYGIPVAQTKWTVYVPSDYTATALLDDPRTNMTPVRDSRSYSSGSLDISNLAKDVDNLYSVYSGSKSSRVRSRVIKNLKRLEEGLKNTPNSNEMRQGQQGQQIKQKIGEIQLREQQRQAQQEKLFGNSRDMNGDGQVDFDSDETFNQLVIGNNAALFEANKGVTFQENVKGKTKPSAGTLSRKSRLSKEKAELRGFSFQRELDKKGTKKKATSKPVDSRALRRKQSFENAAGQIQSPFGLPQQQSAEPNASTPRFNDQVRSGKLSQKGKNDLWMQLNEVEESLTDAKSPNLSFGSNFSGLEREDILNQSVDTESRGQQADWTQAGGISLKFNLPIHGRKLEFTKINGQPKLALSLRSENTYEIGSAVLWTLIWGLISLALIWYGFRFSQSEIAQVRLGAILILIGLAGWLFLSGALAIFGMVFFLTGSICLAYRYVRRAT
ncbi:hypothetical protein [Gimesia aquarii]|uniref:Uncharacterized protein n=1 Tax=Gimesia aquarii TaxID=2527964 RepID=A0A517WPM5_9PLAN|nr:hypothetical protein [Gimesia aquarii]QDU07210.1 hypothetical protein V202x_05610 [Gimesia aquarii]